MSAVSPAAKTLLRAALAALLIVAAPVSAQRLFKYQDENGVWVFTDRQPGAAQRYEERKIERSFEQPEVRLFQRPFEGDLALIAQNTYFAPIQLAYRLVQMDNVASSTLRDAFEVLPPRS